MDRPTSDSTGSHDEQASGELDPRLLGRSDLRAYENGAARLRNVLVETTGGVRLGLAWARRRLKQH